MERFAEYLTEEKELPTENMHVVILGEDDDPGSFAELAQKVSTQLMKFILRQAMLKKVQ